jgi:hypothetical protein
MAAAAKKDHARSATLAFFGYLTSGMPLVYHGCVGKGSSPKKRGATKADHYEHGAMKYVVAEVGPKWDFCRVSSVFTPSLSLSLSLSRSLSAFA